MNVPEVILIQVGPSSLAYTEMRIILAKIIWNFEMILADDSRNWTESQEAWVVWEKPKLNVYLTPRSHSNGKAL